MGLKNLWQKKGTKKKRRKNNRQNLLVNRMNKVFKRSRQKDSCGKEERGNQRPETITDRKAGARSLTGDLPKKKRQGPPWWGTFR